MGRVRVQGHPRLYSRVQASLDCTRRCLNNNNPHPLCNSIPHGLQAPQRGVAPHSTRYLGFKQPVRATSMNSGSPRAWTPSPDVCWGLFFHFSVFNFLAHLLGWQFRARLMCACCFRSMQPLIVAMRPCGTYLKSSLRDSNQSPGAWLLMLFCLL